MLLPLLMNLGMFGSAVDTHDGGGGAHRRKREAEADRKRLEDRRRQNESFRRAAEKIWRALAGHPEPSVVKQALEIAKPAIEKKTAPVRRSMRTGKPVPVSAPLPNFDALSDFRLQQLIALANEIEEEETILLLM